MFKLNKCDRILKEDQIKIKFSIDFNGSHQIFSNVKRSLMHLLGGLLDRILFMLLGLKLERIICVNRR